MIIEAAHAAHTGPGDYAYIMTILVALLTSFYSWRLVFITFFGKPRADHHTMEHVHESPWIMLGPLVALALGAVFIGGAFSHLFIGEGREHFWGEAIRVLHDHDSIHRAHEEHVPFLIHWLPLIVSVLGLVWAYMFYIRRPDLPGKLAAAFPGVYQFLLNKWYFDELYDWLFVKNASRLGRLFWKGGDAGIIDRFGPDGVSAATGAAAKRLGFVQSGYLYHYAFAMIVGIAVIVSWFVLGRAG
jgi:NADH-quinone oxidoreductase subunit L